ncbi:hypothetical protein [Mycobacterium sp. 29Ha]|uniref:hypothetical protein n=1 Tax=Mycobacterium sp. 29Ha TaxID=2939268 RepID=UPI0029392E2F|nr:hypothetical protein [Mycobacterium sp. 29Ha]MDV3136453.1 hypothetical protein [Mycobacterium sp. 29Ha]
MSATVGAVIGISVLALLFVVVVSWLMWSSRISQRGSAEDKYRRSYMELHSPRNRKAMRARQRRNMWAAGSTGAAGTGYIGTGGFDNGGCGGAGCGGGGCGGGGS